MGGDNRHNKRLKIFSRLLFVVYMLVTLHILFMSELFGRYSCGHFRYNLTPFAEISRFYHLLGTRYTLQAVMNLFGNIVILIPFGFYIAHFHRNYRMIVFTTTVYTFVFSLFVETIQLVTQTGTFDVDDLILNTFGGFLAAVMYKIYLITRGKKHHED